MKLQEDVTYRQATVFFFFHQPDFRPYIQMTAGSHKGESVRVALHIILRYGSVSQMSGERTQLKLDITLKQFILTIEMF